METTPETQFDFWLGDWDAVWGANERGANRVERILEGRIIQEHFTAPEFTGISVSAFDTERQLWCQTWVDSNGTYLDFTGGFENGKMILMRDAIVRGEACKQRMVWYDIESDRFLWNWERSDDGGQTWRVLWQIRYTRR
jgi:hypothetical protein